MWISECDFIQKSFKNLFTGVKKKVFEKYCHLRAYQEKPGILETAALQLLWCNAACNQGYRLSSCPPAYQVGELAGCVGFQQMKTCHVLSILKQLLCF